MHVTVNFWGLFFRTGKIFFGLTRSSCLSVRMTDNFSASFGKSVHRLVSTFFENFYFIKKKVTQLLHPFYFFIIKYSKTTCKKHHMHVNIQNMKNTQKCNKNNFQYFFLSLKYKCTIMCNYLNNYNNLNGCSLRLVYIFMKNVQKKMYSLFVWYIFKTSAIQIHSIPIFLYPWLTGQYMLPY